MSRSDGVRAAGNKVGPQSVERGLRSGVAPVDVYPKVMNVHLHLPYLNGFHDGDADAGANIAHEVKNAGGIAHAVEGDGIIGRGSQRNKDESQREALHEQRPTRNARPAWTR